MGRIERERRTVVRHHSEGSLLEVSSVWTPTRRAGGGGVRGEVCEFSASSRRRMMETVARVKRRSLSRALFVTLTYPAVFSDRPEDWHEDLQVWWRRVHRKFPTASCVWRLEAQERGAPHFHLLVFGVRFMAKEWIGETWAEVCSRRGLRDDLHAKAGTSVERVRSIKGAWHYVAKYCAKTEQEDYAVSDSHLRVRGETGEVGFSVGRRWGVMSRRLVPWSPVRVFHVDDFRQRQGLLGYLAKKTGYKPAFDASTHRYYGMFDAERCIVGARRGYEVVQGGASDFVWCDLNSAIARAAYFGNWEVQTCVS